MKKGHNHKFAFLFKSQTCGICRCGAAVSIETETRPSGIIKISRFYKNKDSKKPYYTKYEAI